MAATLSQLQARLDKLQAAMASGALEIRHGDERLTYRSVDELMKAITAVEQQITTAGGTGIVRQFRFTSDKGL